MHTVFCDEAKMNQVANIHHDAQPEQSKQRLNTADERALGLSVEPEQQAYGTSGIFLFIKSPLFMPRQQSWCVTLKQEHLEILTLLDGSSKILFASFNYVERPL